MTDAFGNKPAMAIIVPLLIGALALAIWAGRHLVAPAHASAARQGLG